MNLLIFAHRNEALPFIQKSNSWLSEKFTGVYKSNEEIILICGEGIEAAIGKTSALLGYLQAQEVSIEKVYNIGVAGSLSDRIEIQKIYSLRTIYCEQKESLRFKSFTTADTEALVDGVSSDNRVLTDTYAQELNILGDTVDREAWGIAYACAIFKIPFYCFKIISDRAGSLTNCFEVKASYSIYSQKLFAFYNDFISIHKASPVKSNPEPHTFFENHFYFTQSTLLQIKKLIDILEKRGLPIKDIQSSKEYQLLIGSDLHPKKKTQELILLLKDFVDPMDSLARNQILSAIKDLNYGKNKVTFDPQLEACEINLHSRIESQKDLDTLVAKLVQFNFSEIEKIFNGEINLEL
ncbi:MAG: hypothetical protein KDD50_07615 [Bdellovibrionales bacterium]|nr:hypothetical protein [Bdellovibrionales bacterium]